MVYTPAHGVVYTPGYRVVYTPGDEGASFTQSEQVFRKYLNGCFGDSERPSRSDSDDGRTYDRSAPGDSQRRELLPH